MTACTSPGRTVRVMPLRISLPPADARKSLISSTIRISSVLFRSLSDTSLEANSQQLLRLDRELHRQLLEDLLAEPVHDHRDRVLGVEAPLLQIEDLVLADLGGGRLVLGGAGGVLHVDVREGVGPAPVSDQHRIALRIVARARGAGQHFDLAAVAVLALARA